MNEPTHETVLTLYGSPGNSVFFAAGDTSGGTRVFMERQTWEDMGSPGKITVAVSPV